MVVTKVERADREQTRSRRVAASQHGACRTARVRDDNDEQRVNVRRPWDANAATEGASAAVGGVVANPSGDRPSLARRCAPRSQTRPPCSSTPHWPHWLSLRTGERLIQFLHPTRLAGDRGAWWCFDTSL